MNGGKLSLAFQCKPPNSILSLFYILNLSPEIRTSKGTVKADFRPESSHCLPSLALNSLRLFPTSPMSTPYLCLSQACMSLLLSSVIQFFPHSYWPTAHKYSNSKAPIILLYILEMTPILDLEELDLEPPASETLSTNPSSQSYMQICPQKHANYNESALFPKAANSAHKVGRKPLNSTKILSLMTTSNGKAVKKEYFRCQHIRKLKKHIRNILKGKLPLRDFRAVEQVPLLHEMQRLIMLNSELFATLADTKNGPIPGEKARALFEPKSFNDGYCAAFFHTSEMQTCYRLYLDLIFWDMDPASICSHLKHFCCKGKALHSDRCKGKVLHSDRCKAVWRVIRRYMEGEMLQELGVEVQEVKSSEESVREDDTDWESLLADARS